MKRALLAVTFLLLGCKNAGLATASICDQACACEPCTNNDREACEDAASDARRRARESGCTSEFNAYLTCAEDHISCRDKNAVTKECGSERAALNQCGNGLVPGEDPCKDADTLLKACGIPSGFQPGACEGVTLCSASCIIASDCTEIVAVFNGTQLGGPLVACSSACVNAGSSGTGGS